MDELGVGGEGENRYSRPVAGTGERCARYMSDPWLKKNRGRRRSKGACKRVEESERRWRKIKVALLSTGKRKPPNAEEEA